ncbi:hypothetical protein SAMN05421759_1143 [Roseivivax lentus]|uniref:Uncharacterized protein n=1 Tax=Roseivivax lentus TaxID=633194 RepID=A0A1N7PA29_9RHOB|nr:hypothetical protein [Roseivivax lentus]SIT07377.1 hypothetical protein SAMN05421759_1143 [Roseivivax lentus]
MKDLETTAQDIAPIKKAYYDGLMKKADSAVKSALNVQNWSPVDSAGMGDLFWYWNNAAIFNTATWNQFDNVMQYNADGYLQITDGSALTTGLFNLYTAMAYELTAADQTALNQANMNAAGIVTTVVADYTSLFGAIPAANSATASAKLLYVTEQILSWGADDLTLATFRSSTSPTSLLPNAPLGTGKLISDFMTYLSQTAAAATVQNAVNSYNAQIAQCARNLSPTPAAVKPGWMSAADVNGTASILPYLNIAEPTSTIQNGLQGTQGFEVNMTVTQVDQTTSSVSVNGGAGVSGWIDFFHLGGSAGASYNAFSFDQKVTQVDITMSFTGVTKFTPQLSASAYDISNGSGWWNPQLIKQAANHDPNVSGVAFTTPQPYNFAENGDFGVLDVLAISQLPTIKMVFHNATEALFQSHFQQQSSWSVSFLGIPLAGASQSYQSSTYHYDKTAGTVTVTMTPPPAVIPGTLMTSQAYVIGANCAWPGAQ